MVNLAKNPLKLNPVFFVNEGYYRTAKFRLKVTPWQEQLLTSYAGGARAVYNTILYHTKARYNQHQAEISYGIPEEQLTELVPLNLVGLQNFIQTLKPIWFPWHTQVSKHTFYTGVRNIVKAYQNFFAGRSKYPKYKKKPKHDVTADLSVSMTDINAKWFNSTGSHINLYLTKNKTRCNLL